MVAITGRRRCNFIHPDSNGRISTLLPMEPGTIDLLPHAYLIEKIYNSPQIKEGLYSGIRFSSIECEKVTGNSSLIYPRNGQIQYPPGIIYGK